MVTDTGCAGCIGNKHPWESRESIRTDSGTSRSVPVVILVTGSAALLVLIIQLSLSLSLSPAVVVFVAVLQCNMEAELGTLFLWK